MVVFISSIDRDREASSRRKLVSNEPTLVDIGGLVSLVSVLLFYVFVQFISFVYYQWQFSGITCLDRARIFSFVRSFNLSCTVIDTFSLSLHNCIRPVEIRIISYTRERRERFTRSNVWSLPRYITTSV